MSKLIPFVTGIGASNLAEQYFADSEIRRIPLDLAAKLQGRGVSASRCWLDPAIDGLDKLDTRRTRPWFKFMSEKFENFELMANAEFQSKPVQEVVNKFVSDLLNDAARLNPVWLSVPSLPLIDKAERNKINFALAKDSGDWKEASEYKGRLILPLIAARLDAIKDKTPRTAKVDQAVKCYEASGASGYWANLKSMEDDKGSPSFRKREFPTIKKLSQNGS